jgi:archaellum biogenesis ATPase FlaH
LEYVLTGFAELDKVLETGLASPSCVCISGQLQQVQHSFALQLTYNFLQKGMKGLYICMDRPANEARNQFKRLGLDINEYAENYSLFFIDFFTYSQKALIESSALQNYKPKMLMDTLGPFLDWIKNGFVIVDTLSTLTLNMDAKEAYDVIRGVKLLGRAFGLIIVGIMSRVVSELDPIVTNSDGNIIFEGDTLLLEGFENLHNETLVVSTGKDGAVTLESPFSEAVKKRKSVSILKVLSDAKTLKAVPTLNLALSHETGYMVEEVAEKISPLEEEGNATKTPCCSTVYCRNCKSKELELYLQCPECQSRVLEKGDVLEHFKCGNIDFESNFEREGKLMCQKCNTELKQLGVDYRKIGVGYRCDNKHFFSLPKIVFICAQCREQFTLNEAELQTQYSYELTNAGKRKAVQAGYHPE